MNNITQEGEALAIELLKKNNQRQPITIFMLQELIFNPDKGQKKAIDMVYDSTKHLFIKQRESKQIKDGFVKIFLNCYRLYKMSLSYGALDLDNIIIIQMDNNYYIGKNTCITRIVKVLVDNDYLKLKEKGYKYENNAKASTFSLESNMYDLMKWFFRMKGVDKMNVIFKEYKNNMVLHVKQDGRKYVLPMRMTPELEQVAKDLDKMNALIAKADFGISNMEELQQIYDEINLETFKNQYMKESIYWKKQIELFKKKKFLKNVELDDAELIDHIILYNQEIAEKKGKVLPIWKKINIACQSDESKIRRICDNGSLYESIPRMENNQLYRTYSAGEHCIGCGRAYGINLQQVPRKAQHLITIDGMRACQLDMKTAHPTFICELEGQTLEHVKDFYDIGIQSLEMKSSLNNRHEGIILDKKLIRDKIKLIFNVLLNANSEEQYLDCGKADGHTKEQLTDIKYKYINKYPFIEKYLCTGVGNSLMLIESNYIHKVLNELTKEKLTVIPMMDGLCCKVIHVKRIKEIMYNIWYKLFKTYLKLEQK